MSSGTPFSATSRPTKPDHDVVVGEAELGAGRRRLASVGGAEAVEVDAVAEQAELATRGDAPAPHELEVLGVLHQLDVAEPAGDRLEGVDDERAWGSGSSGAA